MKRSIALSLWWVMTLTLLFSVLARSEGQGAGSINTTTGAGNPNGKPMLRRLYVTVTRGGQAVRGLDREDFTIFENEVRQDLVTFERGESPFAAILLLDASASMKGYSFEAVKPAAQGFLSEMGPLDEIMVMIFSDRPLAMTSFIRQEADLFFESKSISIGGNTALNDHLYAALDMLRDRRGRHVVVLLSDGADISSMLRMEDLLWKMNRSDVLIYWIHPHDATFGKSSRNKRTKFSTSWRDIEANSLEAKGLERAVKESGGRSELVTRIDDVQEAFGEILRELRGQYVLGYYPSYQGERKQWRDVKVRVRARGVKVRTRKGYINDDPEEDKE